MTIRYSVVIVNYHSIEKIVDCLESLIENHKEPDYEIIIVSNSPVTADEIALVNGISSQCRWIQLSQNTGFGQACNKGAEQSLGEYIFFLNPDTEFLTDVLTDLEECVTFYKDKAAAGPATFTTQHKWVPSIKNRLSVSWLVQWLFPFLKYVPGSFGAFDTTEYKKTTEVDIINGSAMFMHRHAYEETNGFSSDYFMYWEENDFCINLKKHGYHILYCPKAKITHDAGYSTKDVFLPMEIEKHRSQKIFLNTHHPFLARLNRITGVLAYSWRLLASAVLFRCNKTAQFFALFKWYLTDYK